MNRGITKYNRGPFKSDRHEALDRSWPSEPIPAYRIRPLPLPVPTRRSRVRELLLAAALLATFAGFGVLIAWRG